MFYDIPVFVFATSVEMVCLPVYTYIVEVYTGELENAGTDANVHLMLVGRRGDTGCRKLLKSFGFADKKFQPGQVCINSLWHCSPEAQWYMVCIGRNSQTCKPTLSAFV